MSGEISKILILWFFFLFINSPSIITFSILNLQKIQLKVELFSIVLRFVAILSGCYFLIHTRLQLFFL